MITETVKAWAAGIVDGEGHISIDETQPRNYGIVVNVGNTDVRIIDILEANWAHDNSKAAWTSSKTGRYLTTKEQVRGYGRKANKDFHRIDFGYSDAEHLLTDIMPHLIGKREEADIVLRAVNAVKSRTVPGSQERVYVCRVLEPFFKELQSLQASRVKDEKKRTLSANNSPFIRPKRKIMSWRLPNISTKNNAVFSLLRDRLKAPLV